MNHAGLLASTFAAATQSGCVTQPSESSTAGISFEELQATAAREPETGAYVIDWDIVLHGDQALYDYWQGSQQGGLTLYSINGTDIKWDATQKKKLKYCIGNGFGGNKAMVARHIPEMAEALYFGHAGNQGDAILWGEALGAGLGDMGAYQGHMYELTTSANTTMEDVRTKLLAAGFVESEDLLERMSVGRYADLDEDERYFNA